MHWYEIKLWTISLKKNPQTQPSQNHTTQPRLSTYSVKYWKKNCIQGIKWDFPSVISFNSVYTGLYPKDQGDR